LAYAMKPIFEASAGKDIASAFISKPVHYVLPDISTLSLFSEIEDKYGLSESTNASVRSKALPPSPPTPSMAQLYRLPAFTLSQFSLDQFKYRDIATVPKLRPSMEHKVQHSRIPPHIQVGESSYEINTYQSSPSSPFFPTQQPPTMRKVIPTPVPSVQHNRTTDFSIQDPGIPTIMCYIEPEHAEAPKPSLRKVDGKSNLRVANSNHQNRSYSKRSIPVQPGNVDSRPASMYSNDSSLSIYALDHFASLCVLDTMLPGNPVAMMSANQESLEGLSEDDQLFLNIQQGERGCLDFVTDQNDQGHFIHYLVVYGALLSISGQDRYMLASLIDVSHLVDAILQDDTGAALVEAEEDVWLSLASDSPSNKVSEVESVSLEDAINEVEDLWRATTHDAQSRSRSRQSARSTDTTLRNFMDDVQSLYKDYFCLSRSLVDSSFYEISLVSPSLQDSGEYLESHLKHTGADTIDDLARNLSRSERFSVKTKWGISGIDKWLYCTPVFGKKDSWVCLLVNGDLPILWDL
jgi:hypothetical protein